MAQSVPGTVITRAAEINPSGTLFDGLSVELQVAVIAAGAALGAALFAFLASIINARVQAQNARLQAQTASNIKLAEFRQRWIDRLRENFVSLQVKIISKPKDLDREISEDIFRILLMMNKDDPQMKELKALVERSLNAGEERRNAQIELMTLLQSVIKAEWEVVKSDLKSGG